MTRSGVFYYWGFGMGLSVTVMVFAIVFITYEYCTQSHLSSEDYNQAIQGLKMTRWFKRHLIWCYRLPATIVGKMKVVLNSIFGGRISPHRNSLLWTSRPNGQSGTTPPILGPMPDRSLLQTLEPSPEHVRSGRVSHDHPLPLA